MTLTSALISIIIILISVDVVDRLYCLENSPFVYREEDE